MRKRLYYMLPDIHSARQMLDEMLLMRVEERHIHFLAKRERTRLCGPVPRLTADGR